MKPCPNPECGQDPHNLELVKDEVGTRVVCEDCGCCGPYADVVYETIRLWDLLPREVQP